MISLEKNQIYTARADGYTAEGVGVFHIEGRAVFVPGVLSGELWQVRILKVTSSVVYGKGLELLEPSPRRVSPDCGAYPRCGGCALRHMSYEEECAMKLRRVNDAFQRIGGLELAADQILPSGPDARERRKVIFNIGSLDGHPVGGFYHARSHEIVPVSECPAVPGASMRALRAVLEWMENHHIPAYDEARGIEGVRHLFYRSSHKTENAVITLVVSRAPDKAALLALTELLQERCPEMTGLVLNTNTVRGNTVLAGKFETIWDDENLIEALCGLDFSLSPRSFFQVNPPQAEKLYELALNYADIHPGTRALDLYCGTGTIGLCMAKRGAQVIGAELVAPAVENARMNALRNGLSDRCEFICADAGQAAHELERRGIRPEVIVVDPPRKGLSPDVISAAVKMAPERIVYISCDPGTLARDLAIFRQSGYEARSAAVVDMFPRTAHVETVVQLSKGNISSQNVRVEFSLEDMDMSRFQQGATYEQIQEWVQEKYGFHVTHLNIAKTKRKCGITERINYNLPKSENSKSPGTPKEKEEAIIDAFRHFQMI